MRAVVLAGGKGTRLKPYTIAIPKPLVPVGETPILEMIIQKLKESGYNHITLAVNHLADLIKAFFNDGSKWDINIDYVVEDKPLSTMGPLTLIKDLPDNFLVMNGDVLTDLDLNALYQTHIKTKTLFTIAAQERMEKIDYGVLIKGDDNLLVGFEEKPSYKFLVSMGIYYVNKKVLDFIPQKTFFGFDHLMNEMIARNTYPTIFEYSGRWLDIGRPDDYEKALQTFINNSQ